MYFIPFLPHSSSFEESTLNVFHGRGHHHLHPSLLALLYCFVSSFRFMLDPWLTIIVVHGDRDLLQALKFVRSKSNHFFNLFGGVDRPAFLKCEKRSDVGRVLQRRLFDDVGSSSVKSSQYFSSSVSTNIYSAVKSDRSDIHPDSL